uniref:CARD domain-containing protein n=1 Tax=Oryzias latipes TaxID=8090 RepID=A0A3B3ILF7_ORYLA
MVDTQDKPGKRDAVRALIRKVADPDPLFDLLLHKKVLSDHSYSEIKALPTDEKKMSKLLMGPYLEAKPACDIVYDFLKKEQPYLVFDLLKGEEVCLS